LNEEAGRIEALDKVVKEFLKTDDKQEQIDTAKKLIKKEKGYLFLV
jgi:hypothetical protein